MTTPQQILTWLRRPSTTEPALDDDGAGDLSGDSVLWRGLEPEFQADVLMLAAWEARGSVIDTGEDPSIQYAEFLTDLAAGAGLAGQDEETFLNTSSPAHRVCLSLAFDRPDWAVCMRTALLLARAAKAGG
ncbi:hypothetical protein ACN20G_33280 (plasmid) [Streptomyces sp. BI20]|uniref:hypothetical protein n=1 Tax=Streptomyces sp. BI20 TaxID=3403460 RepID=UPI003C7743CB